MSNSVKVYYHSNYNGCQLVELNGGDEDLLEDDTHQEIMETIIDHAENDCDEDGYFEGDLNELETFSIALVKSKLGEDTTVLFEEDSLSS